MEKRKQGRPVVPESERKKYISVRLTAEQRLIAERIGDGKVSVGVRRALDSINQGDDARPKWARDW